MLEPVLILAGLRIRGSGRSSKFNLEIGWKEGMVRRGVERGW